MLLIHLLLSTIALFVRIKLLFTSICKLPPITADGVDVSGGSPVRYNRA